MAGKRTGPGHRVSSPGSGEEGPLRERYRAILVKKLTREDLRELQALLRNQFDGKGNLVRANKEKFEGKLRMYLHEEILTRELPGIEALIRGLRPEDLKG